MLNLYDILYEGYSIEDLLNEGKDPVEVLHYKFQNVPSDVIDGIIAIDPTKKKSYSQWALSKWDNEANEIVDSLESGRLQELFNHFKSHNDIQLQSFPSVEKCLNEFVPIVDTVLDKSDKPETYLLALDENVPSEEANDFDIVFNKDGWLIAVPNTYYAECKLGENMKWCTANAFGRGESYYRQYLSQGGKYYVNFDMHHPQSVNGKDYPYTRYQFHFESKQYMDYNDDPIESIENIGIPDSAIEFYQELGYDMDDLEDYDTRYERYCDRRSQTEIRINDDLALMIQFDDDLQFVEPNEHTDYYLYNISNDDRDPICWETFYGNDETFVDNSENGDDWIVLKTGNEELILVYINKEERRYETYETITIKQYTKIGDDLICITEPHRHSYGFAYLTKHHLITCKTPISFDGLDDEDVNIFINEPCTKFLNGNGFCIEIGDTRSYAHCLFRISSDNIECIIKNDEPLNAKIFIPNNNGIITTNIKNYSLLYDRNNIEQDDYNWQYFDSLQNGYDVISYDFDNKTEKYNVLNPNTKKPLFNFWFDEVAFDNSKNGIIGVIKDKFHYILTLDGKFISDGYNQKVGMIDSELFIAAGISKEKIDLIDLNNDNVFATFKEMSFDFRTKEGLVQVKTLDNIDTFYNYKTRQFQIGKFKNLNKLCHYFDNNNYNFSSFYYGINENGENVLFDAKTQHFYMKGLNPKSWNIWNSKEGLMFIQTQDGFSNLFKISEEQLLLPNNIISIRHEYASVCKLGSSENRTFLFDTSNEEYLINSNGWLMGKDVDSISVYNNGGVAFNLSASNPFNYNKSFTTLFYDLNTQQFVTYSPNDGTNYYKRPIRIDQNAPKDVFQYINHLEGRDTQIMNEKFNNILRRISKK